MQDVQAVVRQLGIRPKKGLGQHFLVNRHHLERIAGAADLTSADVVLEVGPGPGTLTAILARLAGHVVAVELDDRLIPYLREKFAATSHVTVVHGDILDSDPGHLVEEILGQASPYKVVANLPYYITSAVLRHLLKSTRPPSLLVVTVQEEVARRMCASPPQMSLLAVSVQFYGRPRLVHRIPRGAFYPVPKVDSAVVRVDVYEQPTVEVPDRKAFFRLVRAGFGQRRKQLRNALAAGLGLSRGQVTTVLKAAGVDPRRRAETLTLQEWACLTRACTAGGLLLDG